MKTSDLIGTATRALRANPLRSALTTLGVIIGVASVVAMVALGSGAQASVERSFASLGSNLLVIVPGANTQGGVRFAPGTFNSLKFDDAEAIAREVPDVSVVAPVQRSGGQIVSEGANWNTQIFGVTAGYLEARDLEIESGRFIEDSESQQARKVVVLGATVARQLFPNIDPVGQRVRINGGSFEVIGVLKAKGQAGFGQDQDDVAVAPLYTVKRRISGRGAQGGGGGGADSVSQIFVKAADEGAVRRAQEDINTLLRQRHKIGEGQDDDFTVQDLQSVAEQLKVATQTFTSLIAGVAGVSLLVGGIGIMNIMLVSVTERTREIGLRKALGARRVDILQQFALESVALSVAGGLVGLALGALLAWGITSVMSLPLVLGWLAAALAVGVSAGVGILFGSYPAWRAARLDPIEALRRQ